MTTTRVTSSDRVRQVGVTLAEVFCVLGTLVGVGVLGTRVEEASGGALAADATLLAPAGPAFSIWSVVYLGLAAYTVLQWVPSQAVSARQRRAGWWAAASMVLNATWLLVTQQGWLWVSVLVIVALLAVLVRVVVVLHQEPRTGGRVETVLVDGTFGLYLGWVAVATCANVTATLVESGVEPGSGIAQAVAVAVLLIVAAVGVLVARTLGGRLAVAAAIAWGLAWIAIGRSADEPRSLVTAVVAAVVAVVVLAAAVALRARTSSGGRSEGVSQGRATVAG